jgi:hypothetical protein
MEATDCKAGLLTQLGRNEEAAMSRTYPN